MPCCTAACTASHVLLYCLLYCRRYIDDPLSDALLNRKVPQGSILAMDWDEENEKV